MPLRATDDDMKPVQMNPNKSHPNVPDLIDSDSDHFNDFKEKSDHDLVNLGKPSHMKRDLWSDPDEILDLNDISDSEDDEMDHFEHYKKTYGHG